MTSQVTMLNTKGAVIIEGHIQGLSMARALGEAGIPVIVVDQSNCIARYSRYTNKFFLCPGFREDDFADFLIRLAQSESIKDWILLPSNDHAVMTLSRNKQRLSEHYKMLVPDYPHIELIYNKVNLLHLAADLGISIPNTYCFGDTNVEDVPISYPVITKGRHGLSFYKTFKTKGFIAHNPNELKQQLEFLHSAFSLSDTFTQTIIPSDNDNKTVSFTAFCEEGKILTSWMGRKLREHPVRFGTATLAESIFIPELIEISGRLLGYFQYTGVCEIEYIRDPVDHQYKLIEINARTWLWVGLAKACGINYALYVYNYLNNVPVAYPSDYETGIKWKNGITDLVYSLIALCKGILSLKTFIRQSSGKTVGALLYRGDNLPAFIYVVMLFTFFRKR